MPYRPSALRTAVGCGRPRWRPSGTRPPRRRSSPTRPHHVEPPSRSAGQALARAAIPGRPSAGPPLRRVPHASVRPQVSRGHPADPGQGPNGGHSRHRQIGPRSTVPALHDSPAAREIPAGCVSRSPHVRPAEMRQAEELGLAVLKHGCWHLSPAGAIPVQRRTVAHRPHVDVADRDRPVHPAYLRGGHPLPAPVAAVKNQGGEPALFPHRDTESPGSAVFRSSNSVQHPSRWDILAGPVHHRHLPCSRLQRGAGQHQSTTSPHR